jgi:hypothetical protein
MADPDELPENVAIFPGETPNNFEPKVILGGAMRNNLESCLVLGWDAEGAIFISSSMSSYADCLWLIEQAKRTILEAEE